MGDIAMALPTLAMLRHTFPDAHITWFVRPEFKALLDDVTGLDDMIVFDRKYLGRWWFSPRSFAALMRLFDRLRKGKFDLVIDLQGLFRTAFFGWLTGCRRRFGMAEAREFATLFYTDSIEQCENSIHVIDYYKKIVKACGGDCDTFAYNLSPDQNAVEKIDKLLYEKKADPDNYVVFVTGSAHENKCWPVEKFARLAEKLSDEYAVSVVAVGTAVEKQTIARLKSLSGAPIIDLTGSTNITELTALLSRARVTVTNDTGPGHVAVALNVPVVMIFGSTNPARIRPYEKPNTVVAMDPDKRGCTINSSDPAYNINAVTVDDVFEKVTWHLSGKGQ